MQHIGQWAVVVSDLCDVGDDGAEPERLGKVLHEHAIRMENSSHMEKKYGWGRPLFQSGPESTWWVTTG